MGKPRQSRNSQQRKESRRQNKIEIFRLYDLAIRLRKHLQPGFVSLLVFRDWQGELLKTLRDIEQRLGVNNDSRLALEEQSQVLGKIAHELDQLMNDLESRNAVSRSASSTAPEQLSTVEPGTFSPIVDALIRIMGKTGIARADALDRALKAQDHRSANARDVLREGAQLSSESCWVKPYAIDGKSITYHSGRSGPGIGLWVLTPLGQARYRQLSRSDPVRSELTEAFDQAGFSPNHGLGIIELAEALEALGCVVERKPQPIRLDENSTRDILQSPHILPDLVLVSAPPGFIPGLMNVASMTIEYERHGRGNPKGHAQWSKRAQRLGQCVIVVPNPKQIENMRLELRRAARQPEFVGLALTAYISNLEDLLKRNVDWQKEVLQSF